MPTSSLPPELWNHPLFANPAEFQPARSPLLAAELDARLRRLRNMPSSCDAAADQALDGLDKLYAWADGWLEHDPPAGPAAALALRLRRAQAALAAHPDDDLARRMAGQVLREIGQELRAPRRVRPLHVVRLVDNPAAGQPEPDTVDDAAGKPGIPGGCQPVGQHLARILARRQHHGLAVEMGGPD